MPRRTRPFHGIRMDRSRTLNTAVAGRFARSKKRAKRTTGTTAACRALRRCSCVVGTGLVGPSCSTSAPRISSYPMARLIRRCTGRQMLSPSGQRKICSAVFNKACLKTRNLVAADVRRRMVSSNSRAQIRLLTSAATLFKQALRDVLVPENGRSKMRLSCALSRSCHR